MLSLLPVIVAGVLGAADPTTATPTPSNPTPASLVLTAPERHVRAPEQRVKTLLAQGFSRSPTFASLLLALNRSDVFVYIEMVMTLPKDTMGRLMIVPGGQTRYLRIQIRADLPQRDAIALLGHEMRHALEVAENPDVRDDGDMIRLYQRIGHQSSGAHSFETEAAQETGRKVRSEFTG
jgi:hypothetical protein